MGPVSGARDFGERGLARAYERLVAELDAGRTDDAMLTIAEMLHWCYALDEFYVAALMASEQTSKNNARGAWRQVQGASDEGETHEALAWVRNVSTHELVNVTHPQTIPGQMTTRRTPGRDPRRSTQITVARGGYLVVSWKPLGDLPPPDSRAHGRDQLYARLVADREVRQPLAAAMRFLFDQPR